MKFIPLILGLIIPAGIEGQVTEITDFTPQKGFNYIFSKSILLTSSNKEYSESFQYFDALGRLIQTVDYKANPTYKDIVRPIEYDNYGRETMKYMPYAASVASGMYRAGWKTEKEQSNFHSGIYGSVDGLKAYAQTLFDNSPLNRILKQGAPGSAWQPDMTTASRVTNEHVTSYQYLANAANEVYYWSITGTLSTTLNVTFTRKNYLANTLFKTIATDENGKPITDYTDKQGKVVLKTDALGGKTYYIYDDFDLLRCVIPPLAIERLVTPSDAVFTTNEAEFKELCYYYEYDSRHRMIKKKLPGTVGYYRMHYDNFDRLTSTTDPNGITDSITYDILSRPVQTTNRTTGQWLTKTFYDTYLTDYLLALPYVTVYYDSKMDKMKGKVTMTSIKVLNPLPGMKVELRSITYYDKYGRVIQTVSENHKGTLERVSYYYKYTNSDRIAEIKTQHGINSGGTAFQTIIEKYAYDHAGRLLSVKHNLNNKGDTTISVMTYNEAGQMTTKKLGNIHTNEFKYNIRGWLTYLNNPDVANNGKLFNLKLEYVYYSNSNNISYMTWNNVDGVNKKYFFTYDNLNRMTAASYFETNANDRFNEIYTYDANGNIKTAKRYGLFQDGSNYQGLIDNLDYVYYNSNYSNRLYAVGDAASNSTGCGDFYEFTDGSTAQEYLYDNNGNLINDQNKYLVLTYNYLNLPQTTSQYPAITMNYCYMADGTKVASKYTYYSTIIKTEYIGPFVYKNDTLDYINTGEGRVVFSGNKFAYYEYHIKDHLGNVRVAFKNVSNKAFVLQKNDYYPFGLLMTAGRTNNAVNKNKYLYNGKEYLEDGRMQMYDYGARMYDPQLGRWHSMDKVAESYYRHSPYSYCFNNPINFFDPNGKWGKRIHNQMIYQTFGGILSSDYVATLMRGSKAADASQYQTSEYNHQHACGVEGLSAKESENRYNLFINNQLNKALEAPNLNFALYELAFAFHAIMDKSSPSHKNFQVFDWVKTGVSHGLGEGVDDFYDPASEPDIIIAEQEMKQLYEQFIELYGKVIVIGEVVVTAEDPKKKMQRQIEDMLWSSVRPNAYGNTGRYNKPGRSTDQYYSDDFLKCYYSDPEKKDDKDKK
jgi:RHS repeat-associated protein